MNTLLFTLEYPPFKGGVANYYENLKKHWPNPDNFFVLDNSGNKLLNSKIWPKWRSGYRELKNEIKKNKIDHLLVGHILPLGTIAYLNYKKTKLPYSIILHGMDFTFAIANRRKAQLTKKILENAQNIICGNSYVAKLVEEFDKKLKNKIYIVNPGVSSDIGCLKAFRHPMSEEQKINNSPFIKGGGGDFINNKIILFSLGRLVKRKGFDKVIEAMPEVLKEIPNLEYIIAGAGPDEEYLKKKIKEITINSPLLAPPLVVSVKKRGGGINRARLLRSGRAGRGSNETMKTPFVPLCKRGNIKFIGEVGGDEKWDWLNKCDIFIMPSRVIKPHPNPLLRKEREHKKFLPFTKGEVRRGHDFEGFGIVYLEANLAGKPVIAGRSGGVADAVEDGVNGLLVDPENTEEIKNAIIKLAKDKSLREKLGQQGKERAIKDFNWQNQANKIYKIISNNFPSNNSPF